MIIPSLRAQKGWEYCFCLYSMRFTIWPFIPLLVSLVITLWPSHQDFKPLFFIYAPTHIPSQSSFTTMCWEGLRETKSSGADVISACHLSDLPSSLNINKCSRCFIGTQLHCSGFFNKIYRAWKWLQLGKQGLQWNRGEKGYEMLERPWEVCWPIGTDCLEMTPVSISQCEGEHFKHFSRISSLSALTCVSVLTGR